MRHRAHRVGELGKSGDGPSFGSRNVDHEVAQAPHLGGVDVFYGEDLVKVVRVVTQSLCQGLVAHG